MRSINLKDVKNNKDAYDKVKDVILNEYLVSDVSIEELANAHSISITGFKYVLNGLGVKKDMSKFNPAKRPGVMAKAVEVKRSKYGPTTFDKEKFTNTCLEKYGVEHHSQLEEIKQRKKETFETNYPKGSEAYNELMRRRAATRLSRLQNWQQTVINTRKRHQEEDPDFLRKSNEKRNQTVMEKIGYINVSQSPDVKNKKKETYENHIREFEKENDCTRFKTLLEKYGQGWKVIKDLHVLKYKGNAFLLNSDIPKIEKYSSSSHYCSQSSVNEKEILDYIKSLYSGQILATDRITIYPQELDIYLPELKVGIEFNGDYWHSDIHKSRNYHLNKTKACEEKGIRLIHIFEYEWAHKTDICKSIIASALGKTRKIYARNCECKPIDYNTYEVFLEENHLQGAVKSSLRFGLFHEGELVQVIGFGKSRFSPQELELYRFCSKKFTTVIGGFSKLLKHSEVKNCVSYIDRSKYTGSSYKKIGFVFDSYTPPSYVYSQIGKGTPPVTRMKSQKHKLAKWLPNFDPTLSEKDNMAVNGYHRIYNCGNIKVILNI